MNPVKKNKIESQKSWENKLWNFCQILSIHRNQEAKSHDLWCRVKCRWRHFKIDLDRMIIKMILGVEQKKAYRQQGDLPPTINGVQPTF